MNKPVHHARRLLALSTFFMFVTEAISVHSVWAEDKKYALVDYGKEVANASMVHSVPESFDLQRDNARFTIVKAEILKLTTPYSTPEKPAQGRIRILKVLRGRNKKVPREADATFSAPYLDGIRRTQKYTMPKPGDLVMISYCCMDLPKYDETSVVSTQNYLVLWTPENEAKVTSTMAAPPRM